MKTRRTILLTISALIACTCTLFGQGTAFTYQGRLAVNGNAANGSYDLRFIMYNSDVGGGQLGPVLTNSATPVASGLFTVMLDFTNGFDGSLRWLEIHVRTNAVGAFIPVVPRQLLTPTPYTITAGSLTSGGVFAGNGSGLTNVNAEDVAFAAIKSLNEKLEEKEAEIASLKKRVEALEQRLERRPAPPGNLHLTQ